MKLTGKIEGQEVTFYLVRQEGRTSVFTAEVPSKLDGEYVVELTAEDDAGNVAFICKYLVTLDLTNLCVHLLPLPDYILLDQSKDYDLQNITPGYWFEPLYPDCAINLGGRI